jgi:hypothetical protein
MNHLVSFLTGFIFLLSFGLPVAAQSTPAAYPVADTQDRLVVFEGFYNPS